MKDLLIIPNVDSKLLKKQLGTLLYIHGQPGLVDLSLEQHGHIIGLMNMLEYWSDQQPRTDQKLFSISWREQREVTCKTDVYAASTKDAISMVKTNTDNCRSSAEKTQQDDIVEVIVTGVKETQYKENI